MVFLSVLTKLWFHEAYTGLIYFKVIPTFFSFSREVQNTTLRLSLALAPI